MDSLTQFTLGAVIGQIVAGRQLGIKAWIIGGLLGTIPDLDVFIGPLLYEDPIKADLFHRTVTHSFFYQILATPFVAYLLHTIRPLIKRSYLWWILIVFLAFATHSLIDIGTAYGTVAFLPFSPHAISTHNMSIIDPIYTLPLLFGLILSWIGKNKSRGRKALWTGTIISTLYRGASFAIKYQVRDTLTHNLPEFSHQATLYETPEIGNTIVWKGILETEDAYYLTRYNPFLSSTEDITRHRFPKQHYLITPYLKEENLLNITQRWPEFRATQDRETETISLSFVDMWPLVQHDHDHSDLSDNFFWMFWFDWHPKSRAITQKARDPQGSIDLNTALNTLRNKITNW